MRARLFTHWSVGLDSWVDTYGCALDRGPVEFTSYLSCAWESIPTETWRDWRAEYDRGAAVQPGVRRDALRYLARELYSSGSIAPTDAVMTVTRAREGRTAWWRTVPDPVRVYRPEDRVRAGQA